MSSTNMARFFPDIGPNPTEVEHEKVQVTRTFIVDGKQKEVVSKYNNKGSIKRLSNMPPPVRTVIEQWLFIFFTEKT